jgi:hypothetical protein
MSRKTKAADKMSQAETEIRETVVKSGLSGVAATFVAVTVCSPAGLGGFIGTGVANGLGGELSTNTLRARDNGLAFPEVRTPLSAADLTDIRTRLRDSASALDRVRRDTDDAIEMLREIAEVGQSASDISLADAPRARDVELARLLLARSQNG